MNRLLRTILCALFVVSIPTAGASSRDGGAFVGGTAFAVTSDGYLITAKHVVDGHVRVQVRSSFDGKTHDAEVVSVDERYDLALLRVKGQSEPIRFGSWPNTVVGQAVSSIGYSDPVSYPDVIDIRPGAVTKLRVENLADYFQFSGSVVPGHSGGPLLDESGLIIGVVMARLANYFVGSVEIPANVSFGIDSEKVKEFVKSRGIALEAPYPAPKTSIEKVLLETRRSVYAVISPRNTAKKRNSDVSEAFKTLLSELLPDLRPKAYGAYRAGFDRFARGDGSIVLLRSTATKKIGDGKYSVNLIFTSERPKLLREKIVFYSTINDLQINCPDISMGIMRKEYKSDQFGIGNTVAALKRKKQSTLAFKAVESENLKSFFKQEVCK